MKYILLALFAIPFMSASDCNNNKVPSCVKRWVDEPFNSVQPDAPMQIDEYIYNGKHVFLFTAQCCDRYNVAYDDQCNAVCAPSGGLTGKGDGKCPDFSSAATHVRLVWRHPANK
jgi:hypothetical protein